MGWRILECGARKTRPLETNYGEGIYTTLQRYSVATCNGGIASDGEMKLGDIELELYGQYAATFDGQIWIM
jgi:hypothetical protein